MGFTSYDDIVSALTTTGRAQEKFIQKSSVTTAAGTPFSLWNAATLPSAGTFGTALTGRSITRASAGAIAFNNPSGGRTLHLTGLGISSTVAAGTLILYDRILELPFNGSTTSGSFIGTTAITARDINGSTDGEGVMMFVENFANTTTSAVNLTVTYTNSAGTGSRSTGAQALIAAGQHRIPMSNIFIPLAAGDTGVRSVQSYTLSATATSTQMNLVLCRPLAVIPITTANAYVERDLVLQLPHLPRIYDDSALGIIGYAGTTSSGLVVGRVLAAEG